MVFEHKSALRSQRLTLSDEGLARVQQDVAAFYNHPFNGQILPDVFSVAHLIVHHPLNTRNINHWAHPCTHLSTYQRPASPQTGLIVPDIILLIKQRYHLCIICNVPTSCAIRWEAVVQFNKNTIIRRRKQHKPHITSSIYKQLYSIISKLGVHSHAKHFLTQWNVVSLNPNSIWILMCLILGEIFILLNLFHLFWQSPPTSITLPVWIWQTPGSSAPHVHEVCVPAARGGWWCIEES